MQKDQMGKWLTRLNQTYGIIIIQYKYLDFVQYLTDPYRTPCGRTAGC